MIPRANITSWRKTAPWPDDTHVEQDLILSRALVEMFNLPTVAEQAVFRGGTALHKLFMDFGGTPVKRAQFEANMAAKMTNPTFLSDVSILLRTGLDYEPEEAWRRVHSAVVKHLAGKPWRGVG